MLSVAGPFVDVTGVAPRLSHPFDLYMDADAWDAESRVVAGYVEGVGAGVGEPFFFDAQGEAVDPPPGWDVATHGMTRFLAWSSRGHLLKIEGPDGRARVLADGVWTDLDVGGPMGCAAWSPDGLELVYRFDAATLLRRRVVDEGWGDRRRRRRRGAVATRAASPAGLSVVGARSGGDTVTLRRMIVLAAANSLAGCAAIAPLPTTPTPEEIPALERIAEAGRPDPESTVRLAAGLWATARQEEAIRVLREAVPEAGPSSGALLAVLGGAEEARGDYEAARDAYLAAVPFVASTALAPRVVTHLSEIQAEVAEGIARDLGQLGRLRSWNHPGPSGAPPTLRRAIVPRGPGSAFRCTERSRHRRPL